MAFYDSCACGKQKQRRNKQCAACYQNGRTSATKPAAESFEASGNTAIATRTTPERVKTLADLIRVCEIDTAEWEVERWIANKWEMGSVHRKSGEERTTELYQIKAWLRRKVALVDARAEIASLLADAKLRPIEPNFIYRAPSSASDYMLEIGIPDLHLGKLAWSQETGHGNYDTRIAQELFQDALSALLARTSSYKFERVLFTVGNDLLHSDNKSGTTTAGTPLDNDSRFFKSFGTARRMIAVAVERLCDVAPSVDVVMVPGNHDQLSVWHMGDSLECLYHADPTVTIFNSANPRKYVQFGKVMLLFTHGDNGKLTDLPLLMATEQPAMFGATRYREAHTGHIHQLRVQELHGVRVRVLSALCPPDAWHAAKAFVGNVQAAECFVWSKHEGLVGTAYYNADTVGTAKCARVYAPHDEAA